jgi:hypothetical protein
MQTERAASPLIWLERLSQDVQYGCRMLAGNPGFATVAIVSLAIGIGANCAIFSFADALLLRPLPVARPGDVMTVGSASTLDSFGGSSLVSSYRDYVDVRDRSKSFEGVGFTNPITLRVCTREQLHRDDHDAGHRPRAPPVPAPLADVSGEAA